MELDLSMTIFLLLVALTFLVSFACNGAIAVISRRTSFGLDQELGVQKFHTAPTSRLGGVGVLLGLSLGLVLLFINEAPLVHALLLIFLSSIPIFLGGLIEDLTHHVPATVRLLLALFSASCFWFLMGFGVERTEVIPVDWLLQWPVMAYLITLLVIAGFTHSVNIIDGFNGLASSQVLLMLASMAFISHQFDQRDLFIYSMLLFSVTLGFFCWNWPLGRIFLGDGGSYFLGFNVVAIGLSLLSRVPKLSPFAPIMIGIYPLVEALFSIYRRVVLRGVSMNRPDALHLHSLIYQRVVRKNNNITLKNSLQNNSKVTVYFFVSTLVFDLTCLLFMTNSHCLFILFFIFIFVYIYIYFRLVTFRTPQFLCKRPAKTR